MVDPRALHRTGFRALFAGLCLAVLFLHILPINLGSRWPSPELPVLLAFAWVLRRPDYVPVVLVGAVMLFADILMMRPIGLWAALVVIGLEFLRSRGNLSVELPFLVEWLIVSTVLLVITLVHGLVLSVLLVPHPPLPASILHLVSSVAIYPLVVAFTAFVLGIRPASAAEREAMGGRA